MRININHTDKIQSAIANEQGKAKVRTITADDVTKAVKQIDARLASIMPKKAHRGLVFDCDLNAQSFPSAYKYTPESTRIVLERGASGWFLVKVYRGRCQSPQNRIVCRNLAERAADIINTVKYF